MSLTARMQVSAHGCHRITETPRVLFEGSLCFLSNLLRAFCNLLLLLRDGIKRPLCWNLSLLLHLLVVLPFELIFRASFQNLLISIKVTQLLLDLSASKCWMIEKSYRTHHA